MAEHASRRTAGRAVQKGSSRHIGDYADFGLMPISWDHTLPRTTRPIKPGFAGHISDARYHYGTSHFAGLPIRGGGRTPLPHKGGPALAELDPSRLSSGAMTHDAELHISSSQEIGRNAWNLGWAGHATQKRAATPRTVARRQRVERQMGWGQHPGAPSTIAQQPQSEDAPAPSFRQSTLVPMSRDPRGPSAAYAYSKGGIIPRYTGHVPGVYNHYGSTHVGGSFTDFASAALPGRAKAAWEETGRSDLQA